MTGHRRQRLTPAVPVVHPVEARRGRFVVSRKKWDELAAYAGQLEAALRARQVTLKGWELCATFHTASHEWALYARPRQPAKP